MKIRETNFSFFYCSGICSAFYWLKDTVLVKDELNQFLRALGERNCRVVGETTAFFRLQKDIFISFFIY